MYVDTGRCILERGEKDNYMDTQMWVAAVAKGYMYMYVRGRDLC